MKCIKKCMMLGAIIVAACCGYLSGKVLVGVLTFLATLLPVIIWFYDNKENEKRDEKLADVVDRTTWRILNNKQNIEIG